MSKITSPVVTENKLALFENEIEKYFVKQLDMQETLEGFADKPYLRQKIDKLKEELGGSRGSVVTEDEINAMFDE